MKSRSVQACEQIMRRLVKAGYTQQVSDTTLEKVIMVVRGGDPRTVKNWTNTLRALEYISPVGVRLFKLNVVKVQGLLELAVEIKGQKKLV